MFGLALANCGLERTFFRENFVQKDDFLSMRCESRFFAFSSWIIEYVFWELLLSLMRSCILKIGRTSVKQGQVVRESWWRSHYLERTLCFRVETRDVDKSVTYFWNSNLDTTCIFGGGVYCINTFALWFIFCVCMIVW